MKIGSIGRFAGWIAVFALLMQPGAADTVFAGASPFRPLLDAAAASTTNHLAIVSGGYDALLLRVHLIRAARRSIDIQTFIWSNDECGRLLMYELVGAARRGVRVRIIADQMVSEKDPGTAAFLSQVHTNLEVRHYRPAFSRLDPSLLQLAWKGLTRFHDINQRMHNKVMLFDGVALLTGGRNIENTYFDHSTEMNFRDRDVLAIGPVAEQAAESFEEFWDYRHTHRSLDLVDVRGARESGKFPRLETRDDYAFGSFFTGLDGEVGDPARWQAWLDRHLQPVRHVEFIADVPGKKRGLPLTERARITRRLKHVLEEARESIVVQTPYLVLSKAARKLFRNQGRQHPNLRIRISSNSFASTDNLLAYSANYRLRGVYVEDLGLEIHEYRPVPADWPELFPRYPEMKALAETRIRAGRQARLPFLCIHAKSLVVDGRLAYIGSYNLDPRSENLNTEVGLLVEDEAFAHALQAEIERDMEDRNSWTIARRKLPLGMGVVNGWIDGVLSLSPVDIWPVQNTSSFELAPGGEYRHPGARDFHAHYREVGSFPGAEGALSTKEILTRIYKAVGSPLTPIL
ncbi:MAG TPA: phospholipase D family protein [Kiritimatiellia bacterium]|nr:phospholipase D family protein [Kiritimatiellia bacterium]